MIESTNYKPRDAQRSLDAIRAMLKRIERDSRTAQVVFAELEEQYVDMRDALRLAIGRDTGVPWTEIDETDPGGYVAGIRKIKASPVGTKSDNQTDGWHDVSVPPKPGKLVQVRLQDNSVVDACYMLMKIYHMRTQDFAAEPQYLTPYKGWLRILGDHTVEVQPVAWRELPE